WEEEYQGQRRLFLSDVPVLIDGDQLKLMFDERSTAQVQVFPALEKRWSGSTTVHEAAHNGLFEQYQITSPAPALSVQVDPITSRKVQVKLDESMWDQVDDVLLQIDYEGNVGFAFANGALFHDHFYNG